MTWLLWTGVALGIVAALLIGLSAYGDRRWTAATAVMSSSLEAARTDHGEHGTSLPARYDARELEGLPAPVERYFRAVLKDGQPIISAVTITMSGTFNLAATGERWKPFVSTQRVTTRRPGFLWNAGIRILPVLTVKVVDSYIARNGLLHAAILGLYTMADTQGRGEIARGEFMRWFAEVPWYPTALLPSQGVQWAAVDAHSAMASVVDGPITLSLLFRFDNNGLIESFRAEARGAMVGKEMIMAPWEGKWSDYRTHDGVMVPFTGEVGWVRAEGLRPYFKGTVTSLTFEFAQ